MLSIDLIVIGALKKGSLYDLCADYQKKIRWRLNLHVYESKIRDPAAMQIDEHKKIMSLIKPDSFVVAMDERGQSIKSTVFASKIETLQDSGQKNIQFIIGGADGLNDVIRSRANLLLSFGKQTWPHMFARVMLLEQIYRAQQILAGHPYHRE